MRQGSSCSFHLSLAGMHAVPVFLLVTFHLLVLCTCATLCTLSTSMVAVGLDRCNSLAKATACSPLFMPRTSIVGGLYGYCVVIQYDVLPPIDHLTQPLFALKHWASSNFLHLLNLGSVALTLTPSVVCSATALRTLRFLFQLPCSLLSCPTRSISGLWRKRTM